MKRLLPLIFLLLLLFGGIVLLGVRLLKTNAAQANLPALPTLAELSSPTVTETAVPTALATLTATDTPSPTLTFTPTSTFTPSATLATRVLVVTAVNPGVNLNPVIALRATEIPTALPTLPAPTPPARVALMPTGDSPQAGWYGYDARDKAIRYEGKWDLFTGSYHSTNRHYMYSDDDKARATFRFLGAAVRLKYVKYYTYGIFQVRLDDQVVSTVDSYYPKIAGGDGDFVTTDVFGLANGWHTLEVIHLPGQKNPASQGTFIAIDGIDVYADGPAPTPMPTVPTATVTLTPSPLPAQKVELLIAPPTVQPTATLTAPKVVAVSLLIAYDENNNHAVDPAEGVSGVSVRLVTIGTNQVIASGYTNAEGYIHVEAMTDVSVRIVVPYFGKFWDVSTATGETRITLLLPPGNQPGLIP